MEGLSGATPWEICQRYAAGLLNRERLMVDGDSDDTDPVGTSE